LLPALIQTQLADPHWIQMNVTAQKQAPLRRINNHSSRIGSPRRDNDYLNCSTASTMKYPNTPTKNAFNQ
jgi:hypothetical protein